MSLPSVDESLPLAGIRVIDFGTTVAGPSASRMLADFGAQVIRIESQVHPDTLRVGTPYAGGVRGVNRSGYFAAYNAGKLSFSLNLQKPEARDIVRRLVEHSDVVLETFAPGVMGRWGLTYRQLSEWKPSIIMASHSLQGQTGPHSPHRGYGQIASAMGGWYDLTGLEDGEPLGPYSAYTDFLSWPFLVTALLIALEIRDETGLGQHIDHAQIESSIHFLAPLLVDLQVNDRLASRHGNHEDYAAPCNTYACAGEDRWIAITVSTDDQWVALCNAMGHSETARDDRFATLASRKASEAELDLLVGSWVSGHPADELATRLQRVGVSAGQVARAEDLMADRQLAHRGFFKRLDHAEMGEHAVLTQAFRISGLDISPRRSAPLLGEHTYAICKEILELTDDHIAELTANDVLA